MSCSGAAATCPARRLARPDAPDNWDHGRGSAVIVGRPDAGELAAVHCWSDHTNVGSSYAGSRAVSADSECQEALDANSIAPNR